MSQFIQFENIDQSILKETKEKQTKKLQTLSLKESKQLKSHESYEKMLSSIDSKVKTLKLASVPDLNTQQVKIKISPLEMADILFDTCDMAKYSVEGSLDSILFIEDCSTGIMQSDTIFFETIMSDLCARGKNFKIDIDDIKKFTTKMLNHLNRRSDIRTIKELPSTFVVTHNHFIIDLINKQVKSLKEMRLEYDITSQSNLVYLDQSTMTKDQYQQIVVFRQIISRIMKDWSDGNEEKEYLLWQMIYSVLQKDNHGKFFIIKGPGGNGKSLFTMILCGVAQSKNTVFANIHQFGDPNSINTISHNTRVIIGDDAATNHKISDVALSNIKSIVTNQALSVNVKYEKNKIIKSNALFVQCTNTDISFYENNPAVNSRAIVIDWTRTNFRDRPEADKTFDLNKLITNQLFISTIAMMCIEKVEYFKEFKITNEIKQSTQHMIESNDTLSQFLNHSLPLVNGFQYIPCKILYRSYENWMKNNNPRGGIMKYSTFHKMLNEKQDDLKTFDLATSHNRKRFKTYESIESLTKLLEIDYLQSSLECQSYLISSNMITTEEIESFKNKNHPIIDLNDRELQILSQIIFKEKNNYFYSIYNDYFS